MDKYAIIPDVHGCLETLKALLAIIPSDHTPIFLGDLIDRGPDSPGVVQLVMDGGWECLMGNHEHMALNSWEQGKDPGFTRAYRWATWEVNGGGTQEFTETQKTWIDNLPSVIFKKSTIKGVRDLVLTHAPLCKSLESALNSAALTGGPKHHFLLQFLWNRWGPVKVRNLFQVFGHDVRGLKPTLENSYFPLTFAIKSCSNYLSNPHIGQNDHNSTWKFATQDLLF